MTCGANDEATGRGRKDDTMVKGFDRTKARGPRKTTRIDVHDGEVEVNDSVPTWTFQRLRGNALQGHAFPVWAPLYCDSFLSSLIPQLRVPARRRCYR